VSEKLKLLHIDDSSILRKTVSRGLEEYKDNYELTQVGSVDEALDLLYSGKKFDVILTDWLMPGKSGLNLLCILKSHPAYHHLPVFFLTSEYENSSLVTAVTFGAAGLLKKPITGPEIHAYLQKRISAIAEAHSPKEDTFASEARRLLSDIQQLLPLKSKLELSGCLQHIQDLKIKARATTWPLLAEYSQKMDDLIQIALKKDRELLSPLTDIINDYRSFAEKAVTEIENGRPHNLLSEDLEKIIKSYLLSLDAVLIPWEMITELQKHLSPEGLLILDQYLNSKKSAS
jgi:CheY-like chemotaxis protein